MVPLLSLWGLENLVFKQLIVSSEESQYHSFMPISLSYVNFLTLQVVDSAALLYLLFKHTTSYLYYTSIKLMAEMGDGESKKREVDGEKSF